MRIAGASQHVLADADNPLVVTDASARLVSRYVTANSPTPATNPKAKSRSVAEISSEVLNQLTVNVGIRLQATSETRASDCEHARPSSRTPPIENGFGHPARRRWLTSTGRGPTVRLHSETSSELASHRDVSRSGSVSERVLRLANSTAELVDAATWAVASADQGHLWRKPRHLRKPACSRRTIGARNPMLPKDRGENYATRRTASRDPTQIPSHDRLESHSARG